MIEANTMMAARAYQKTLYLVIAAIFYAAAANWSLAEEPAEFGLQLSLSTNAATYQSGEPIQIRFTMVNQTGTPIRLEFTSAQRFDVTIGDAHGSEVWRWSAGRMFATVMGNENLGPGNPRLTNEAIFKGPLSPGLYRIRAWLTDARRRFSSTIEIEVR